MQNEMDCKVARDLMPLHVEGLLSQESESFLTEHLSGCQECQAELNRIKENIEKGIIEEKKRESRFVNTIKRYRYELVGLTIGFILVIGIIAGAIIYLYVKAHEVYDVTYTSTEDYGKEIEHGFSKLYLFPDKAQVADNIVDYYYDGYSDNNGSNYIVYAECQYSPDEYLAEKNRLLNVKDKKAALYDENELDKPIVYAMMYDAGYEYAVLDEEHNEIYYIYLEWADRRDVPFDKSFLPKDYGQNGYNWGSERDAYSIYDDADL